MTDYHVSDSSFNGILDNGDRLLEGGFDLKKLAPDNRQFICRRDLNKGRDPLIKVTGNNVTIQNVRLFHDPNIDPQTAIRILGSNCTISNVYIDGLFDVGIEMPTDPEYSPSSNNRFEHIKMRRVKKGIVLSNNENLANNTFENLTIQNVGITLDDTPPPNTNQADTGFLIDEHCILDNSKCILDYSYSNNPNAQIIANTWFERNAHNACGMKIKGQIKNCTIKYATERLGNQGTPNGYGLIY
jgi:hypothetical protein